MTTSASIPQLKEWLQKLVTAQTVPGAAAFVRRGKDIRFYESFGFADLDDRKPFERDSIFRAFSMTKPLTSFLALQLVAEKTLELDSPVADFLPCFKNLEVFVGGTEYAPQTEPCTTVLTIDHLLNHTAGFSYDYYGLTPVERMYHLKKIQLSSSSANLAELCEKLAEVPLHYQPGSFWSYGYSTDVLARVLEVASGKQFSKLMQDSILDPLDMQDSGFYLPAQKHSRFTSLYTHKKYVSAHYLTTFPPKTEVRADGLLLTDHYKDSQFLAPMRMEGGGWGLLTTLSDYGKFGQMLLSKAKDFLPETLFNKMLSNHLSSDLAQWTMPKHSFSFNEGRGIGFGYGLAHIQKSSGLSGQDHFFSGAANTFFLVNMEEQLFACLAMQIIPHAFYPFFLEFRNLVRG